MIGIALAGIAFGLIAFLVSVRLVARGNREHAREARQWEHERQLMIDKLCHVADKPWSSPPARAPEVDRPSPREPSPDEELAVW